MHEFVAITQYDTSQQLVEWLGQQVTGATMRMAAEQTKWGGLPTQTEKTEVMARQLTEANARITALEGELKKARKLLAI